MDAYTDLVERLQQCAAAQIPFVILTPIECLAIEAWRVTADRAARPNAGRPRKPDAKPASIKRRKQKLPAQE